MMTLGGSHIISEIRRRLRREASTQEIRGAVYDGLDGTRYGR